MYSEEHIQRLISGLAKIVAAWDMTSAATIKLLTVSENATFIATEGTRKIIVRVHAPDYHSYDEVKSELAWILDLKQQNILNTPSPIALADGEYIATVSDGQRDYLAVAFEFMQGQEPDVSNDLAAWFEELGAITAKLHQHAKNWQRPEGFTRKKWNLDNCIGPYGYWGDWQNAANLTPVGKIVIKEAISVISQRLEAYGMGASRFGLVHADLRLTNLLITESQMSVIDFDDSGFCWYAYDFAAAISFHELDKQVPDLKQAWIKGYRSVASFSQADEEEIDTFIMLRRIMLTAWLASHSHSNENQTIGSSYTNGTVCLARLYVSKNTLNYAVS